MWKDDLPSTIRKDTEIAAPWQMILESLPNSASIRITASGSWRAIGGLLPACAPDGLSGVSFDAKLLLLPNCPVGALIGKFGGSSASLTSTKEPTAADAPTIVAPAEGQIFAIGSYCVVKVPENSKGPLFIGFNTVFRPITIAEDLVVTVGKLA